MNHREKNAQKGVQKQLLNGLKVLVLGSEKLCVFSCSCLCVFVVFASPWGPVMALGNWFVFLWSFCICLQKVCVSFHFTLLSAVIWLHYTENKPLLSESSEAGRNTGGQWNCASPRVFISNYFITPVFAKYWYFLPICNHSKMMLCSMMLILRENNLKTADFLCIAHWCLAEWRDWLKEALQEVKKWRISCTKRQWRKRLSANTSGKQFIKIPRRK